MTPNAPGRWRRAMPYAVACAVSLLTFTWLMKLWQTNLRVPLTYYGEAMYNALLVKTVMDFGWHQYNPALAAPGALNLLDVPMGDNNLHFLLIKLLGLFTNSYGLVLNLFLILTFPLVTLSAMYVLRRFGVSPLVAGVAALLYTFLPFHFVRGQHHLFFAAYFLVPLAVLLVLWVGLGRVQLFDQAGRVQWRDRRLVGCVVICLLLAAGGTYFAYFTCIFLLLAAFLRVMRTRQWRALALPALFIALIFGGLMLNLLPAIIHLRQHGETPIVRRHAIDAELYGFRIAQLLMPVTGHRFYPMARLKAAFNQRPWINENDDASLGVVGVLGFAALIGWLFLRKPEINRAEEDGTGGLISHLSIYNFTALMLGAFGSLGAIIALVLTSKIRGYNRISIFIAFFSLTALAVLVDGWVRRRVRTRKQHLVVAIALAGVLVLGVLDQFAPRFVPEYGKIRAEFDSDANFMRTIESRFPAGTMIFQLPIVPFPEALRVGRMYDYDHTRGFLHSQGLRWSYGAMKGRADEVWQQQLAEKSMADLVPTLILSGFQAIYLNRDGYNGSDSPTERALIEALGPPSFFSDNSRLVLFDLREREKKLRQEWAADWEQRRENALHPILVVWTSGFSDREPGAANTTFRWAASEAHIKVINGATRTRRARFTASFTTENEANLWISGPLINAQLRTSKQPTPLNTEFQLPPGEHFIYFKTDAQRVLAPGDFRHLFFKMTDFQLTPVD